jgi:hypothetical protein
VYEAAQSIAPLDRGGRRWAAHGVDFLLRQLGWYEILRAMRPMHVVVIDEDAEHAFEVAAVHDQ